MSGTVDAVRGMRDILPADQRAVTRVRAIIESLFAQHGYAPIDLPVIEHRELYLRKLGEDLVGKVYEFNFGGRDLALRPEWTASVLRAYVANLQDQPLPLRLSYSGPVFRYQRPQRDTYRQFTQVGVELVGGPAPIADAEVIALACAGLDAAGVAEYRVRIGHIGLVRELLSQLDLEERTQNRLVWSLERMRQEGVDAVRARLHDYLGDPPRDLELPEGLDDEQAISWLLHMFAALQIDLNTGTRTPEDVVRRLLNKLRRTDPQPRIERALDLLVRLSQIRGMPAKAMPQAAELLAETGLRSKAYAELQSILTLLEAHGVHTNQIELDFGIGRGLQYYSGLIFEIYNEDQRQLCGGGRYDDLVGALGGGQQVPAVGFAYGLERVIAAATSSPGCSVAPQALVVPVAADDYSYALEVARRLRQQGFATIVDVRGRSVASNLRDASRRGIDYVAIVGTAEREKQSFVWRNLKRREERQIGMKDVSGLFEG